MVCRALNYSGHFLIFIANKKAKKQNKCFWKQYVNRYKICKARLPKIIQPRGFLGALLGKFAIPFADLFVP